MKHQAFWLLDESNSKHLRFVISDGLDGLFMVVHMTTYHGFTTEDTSCILHPGDHDTVKHDSWINYSKALELNGPEIGAYSSTTPVQNISKIVLRKIQEGARNSERLPKKFRKYFDYF